MNSKDFLKVLRTVIREEVRAAVRAELRVLNESRSVNTASKWSSRDAAMLSVPKNPVTPKKKTFTKDPLLNDLLNDTASRPVQLTETYDTIGTFSAEMARGFMPAGQQAGPIAPPVDLDGRPVNMSNENVATVVNAMTKDYSALMKAIDKKKGKS